MGKKEAMFNEIVRKVRKEHFGKGPESIRTTFVDNMAVSVLHGNLTPTEKFIAQTPQGSDMVHLARTKMIQQVYAEKVPDGMEEVVGAKLLYLFSDIKVEEDMAVSVFIFDRKIDDK
ncbi:DUF2294 domain-containing protein [Paenactinomyces guangxiensis]|uniref:DUF2294 domain-containing protein n=1 Tax=Paenactinomyces guangxiensis TaxID=1490290 RepID=A0A7W1WPT5_9BACL|nr:DUF2294 domain-containing protein [Paenactinomyces guangxiensis]MBA4493800.1 DUF2294 domain-containing protein [Paenactinomyces guangxiensis]MBH8591266.1 DUF2294 domain-containing protein [Paenactinomyces guangxiensis]